MVQEEQRNMSFDDYDEFIADEEEFNDELDSFEDDYTETCFHPIIPKITSGAMLISVTAQSPVLMSVRLAPNR